MEATEFEQNEQPINWWRAFVSGVFSSLAMMAFADAYYLMGLSPFSYEYYLGSLLRGSAAGVHNFTVGLFASMLLGGLFGMLYGYFFEYFFQRAGARLGTYLGFGHAILAGLFMFPFFNILHEQIGTGVYPHFGLLGSGLSPVVPVLILVSHLLFGMGMGTFYGPVNAARIQAREWEPGDTGYPGEIMVVASEEDAEKSWEYRPSAPAAYEPTAPRERKTGT